MVASIRVQLNLSAHLCHDCSFWSMPFIWVLKDAQASKWDFLVLICYICINTESTVATQSNQENIVQKRIGRVASKMISDKYDIKRKTKAYSKRNKFHWNVEPIVNGRSGREATKYSEYLSPSGNAAYFQQNEKFPEIPWANSWRSWGPERATFINRKVVRKGLEVWTHLWSNHGDDRSMGMEIFDTAGILWRKPAFDCKS